MILVGRLYGRKVVVHYHDGRAAQHLAGWRSARLLRLADRIMTPSGYLVRVFAQYGYRAEAIFNTIDLGRFRYRERNPVAPVFLHNRGMEELYNIPCALRAFGLVQQRYPASSLVLAHDGPLRGALERMVAEWGLRNVRFVGKVEPESIPKLYDEAGIYLTSSNIDNMPLSLLECYASGLPVVATQAGGIPDMAGDRGNRAAGGAGRSRGHGAGGPSSARRARAGAAAGARGAAGMRAVHVGCRARRVAGAIPGIGREAQGGF